MKHSPRSLHGMADRHSASRIEGDTLHLAMVNEAGSVQAGQAALRAFLGGQGITGSGGFQAELAFEELVMNVLQHAYAGVPQGQAAIAACIVAGDTQIVVTIEDSGRPFDPVRSPEWPLPASLEQATPGGLGIRFVRASAARITHQRAGDTNRTTVWVDR